MWLDMPLILLFWKQKQVDDCKFKTSLVYLTSSGSVSVFIMLLLC